MPRSKAPSGDRDAMTIDVDAWRADEALAKCAPATRGIWIDALFAMHKRQRCGEICGSVEQLAQICRTSADAMAAALDDLARTETADLLVDNSPCDVFVTPMSRENNSEITLRNRRMFREHKQRLATRERQDRYRSNAKVTAPRAGARSDPPSKKGILREEMAPRNGEVTAPKKKPSDFTLPDWINPDQWREFEEFRRRAKKPLTQEARKRAVAKLAKMREDGTGSDANAVLQQTIDRGWSGLFPTKRDDDYETSRNNGRGSGGPIGAEQRVTAAIRRRDT